MFENLPFCFRVLIELFCKPKERYMVTSWINWYNELSEYFVKKYKVGERSCDKIDLILKFVKEQGHLETVYKFQDINEFVFFCFCSQSRFFHLNVYNRKNNPKYFYQKDQKKISEEVYEMCKIDNVEVKVGVFLNMDLTCFKKKKPFVMEYKLECIAFNSEIDIPKEIYLDLLSKIQNDKSTKSINRLCKRTLMSYFKIWCFFNSLVSEHYDTDNEYFVTDEYFDFLNLICAPPKANIKDENSMPYFKDKKFSTKIWYFKEGDIPVDRDDKDSYYYDFNDSTLDQMFKVYTANMFDDNYNTYFYDAYFMFKCAKFFFNFVNDSEIYSNKHIYIYNFYDVSISSDFSFECDNEMMLEYPYYTFFYCLSLLNYVSNEKSMILNIN